MLSEQNKTQICQERDSDLATIILTRNKYPQPRMPRFVTRLAKMMSAARALRGYRARALDTLARGDLIDIPWPKSRESADMGSGNSRRARFDEKLYESSKKLFLR